jgi:AcrR family transcriptional regulator
MDDSPPPTAKRRTRDDPAVRRAQIIDEAIRIIGERGYYGFAVQDLAARCGLTTGGLLYHFGTKEGLLLAVLDDYERRMEARLLILSDGLRGGTAGNNGLSLSAVRTVLRAVLTENIAEPELARLDAVLDSEALYREHPGHSFFRDREARFLSIFAGVLTPHCPDPLSTTRQVYSLMQGLMLQWLRAEGGFDIAAEWDRAIAKILPEGEVK